MEQPSESESQIIGVLNNLHIVFDRERTFPDLISKNENVLLPVDFALNINGFLSIIEYNGSQHYKAMNSSTSAKNAFRRLSANGTTRLEYCNKNNIPLLIIHYKDKGKIIKIISDFIEDVKNNLHNNTKSYSAHTKGYFKNIPYSTFDAVPTGPIKPIQLHENDTLGYMSLSNDAIIWTKKELDTLLSRITSYENKIEELKTVTADLILTINSLQHELEQKNAELQSMQPDEVSMTRPEPRIKLDFINPAKVTEPEQFVGDFRKNSSPRSQITDEAKIFIRSLSIHYRKVSDIQEYLKKNYHENISLPTLKRCLLPKATNL